MARKPVGAVETIAGLRAAGIPARTVHHRVRSGHWQRPLPGVVITHSGPPTRHQLRQAALAHGGAGAVLSHASAGVLHGLRITETEVQVTLPHGRTRRAATPGFRFHQSRFAGGRVLRDGLPCTGPARTVVDLACGLADLDDVRALLSDAVQRGLTSVTAVTRTAQHAPRHGRRRLRVALDEIAAGARSGGEAEFLALVRRFGLPMPEFNARLRIGGRTVVPDALWRDRRLIVEIDGAAWHLHAVAWQRDLRRQNALHAAGFVVLRFSYDQIRNEPQAVAAQIRQVLAGSGSAA